MFQLWASLEVPGVCLVEHSLNCSTFNLLACIYNLYLNPILFWYIWWFSKANKSRIFFVFVGGPKSKSKTCECSKIAFCIINNAFVKCIWIVVRVCACMCVLVRVLMTCSQIQINILPANAGDKRCSCMRATCCKQLLPEICAQANQDWTGVDLWVRRCKLIN